MNIGDFAADIEDVDNADPAIVVHSAPEFNTYIIRRTDGHLSTRTAEQLKKIDAQVFVKVLCKNQLEVQV